MIIFNVVQESYGWAIRRDDRMMVPAWCKAVAIEEAQRMVDLLRRNGEAAEIRIETRTVVTRASGEKAA